MTGRKQLACAAREQTIGYLEPEFACFGTAAGDLLTQYPTAICARNQGEQSEVVTVQGCKTRYRRLAARAQAARDCALGNGCLPCGSVVELH